MKKILLTFGALGLALAPALAADPGPEAVVKKLYAEPHPKHSAVYTKRLQSLFDADAKQANGATGNLDFDYRLNGEPLKPDTVKNLTFTGELMYTLVDQKYAGAAALPAVSTKPAALFELKDQRTLTLYFRAQRTW